MVKEVEPEVDSAPRPIEVEETQEPPAAPLPVQSVAAEEASAPKFKSPLLQQMLGNRGRLKPSADKGSDKDLSESSADEVEVVQESGIAAEQTDDTMPVPVPAWQATDQPTEPADQSNGTTAAIDSDLADDTQTDNSTSQVAENAEPSHPAGMDLMSQSLILDSLDSEQQIEHSEPFVLDSSHKQDILSLDQQGQLDTTEELVTDNVSNFDNVDLPQSSRDDSLVQEPVEIGMTTTNVESPPSASPMPVNGIEEQMEQSDNQADLLG